MITHPLTPLHTRAGYATEALRALLLLEAEPAERELIDGTLRDLGARLRAVPWRTPAIRRAALRLASAVESDRDAVLD